MGKAVFVWPFMVILLSLCLSPKFGPSGFFDHLAEAWLDLRTPIETLTPVNTTAVKWQDVLKKRPCGCPPYVPPDTCAVSCKFKPRPDDIIITTPAKTGTTMLQQMTHQLRTGGDMSFKDIYDVQPWILLHPTYRGPAEAVEQPSPRVFKNHNSLAEFDGGRHIVTLRDPMKTLLSWYTFMKMKSFPGMRSNAHLWLHGMSNGLTLDTCELLFGDQWKTPLEFAKASAGWRRDMHFGVSFFEYIVEFWLSRHDPNVLVLTYEDLADDKLNSIKLVGKFMSVEVTEDLLKLVANRTSKAYMKEHISKFDESVPAPEINSAGKLLVPYNPAERVSSGGHDGETQALKDLLAAQWKEQVLPVTGIQSYEEMRRIWRLEMVAKHPEIFTHKYLTPP